MTRARKPPAPPGKPVLRKPLFAKPPPFLASGDLPPRPWGMADCCTPPARCDFWKITDARRLTPAQRCLVVLCPAHSREVAAAMDAGAWERILRILGVFGILGG